MATRVWFPQSCEEKRWWSCEEYSVNQKTLVIESKTYYCQLYEEGSDRLRQKMSVNNFRDGQKNLHYLDCFLEVSNAFEFRFTTLANCFSLT